MAPAALLSYIRELIEEPYLLVSVAGVSYLVSIRSTMPIPLPDRCPVIRDPFLQEGGGNLVQAQSAANT
jgi:hypothetical protein